MVRHTYRLAIFITDKLSREGDWPGLRLSLRRCCLLTKQAARVLNSTAAARKQIVATTPATTGRASPSSGSSAGGKGSDGANERLMESLLTIIAKHFCAYFYMCNVSLSRNWPVLDTPTTLLLSLIRSSMTAITRNSYQDSCERKTNTLFSLTMSPHCMFKKHFVIVFWNIR